MTYDCASAPMPDIAERLKEHAEWAEANIYEVPITLPDDITEAIKEIEQLVKERDAAVADLDKEADYYGDLCFFCSKDGDCKKCEWEWRGVREVDNETD